MAGPNRPDGLMSFDDVKQYITDNLSVQVRTGWLDEYSYGVTVRLLLEGEVLNEEEAAIPVGDPYLNNYYS